MRIIASFPLVAQEARKKMVVVVGVVSLLFGLNWEAYVLARTEYLGVTRDLGARALI